MAVRERMLVYSPQDEFLFDIPESQVYDGSIRERINGEHSITITTSFVLDKEQRLLWRDRTGKWREYVISAYDSAHRNGLKTIGTYDGVWSLQHDLQVSQVSRMPGVETPVTAGEALGAAISGTARWAVGTVTIATTGGASMYDMQSWDALKVLLEVWGGEIDARITVGSRGVISRYVDYSQHIGSSVARRRFEFARDMTGIDRIVESGPVACRIVPRGKGEETDAGGYGRKIKIGDVNGGVDWLQNNASAELYRLPDGNGGYEYPTVFVDNGDIEDKQELKDWGLSVLNEYTTPKVTYKADVLQLHAAGMDVNGVSLGDNTLCVDRKFSDTGLKIEGRIVEQVIPLKDKRRVSVTIGYVREPIAVALAREGTGIGERIRRVEEQSGRTTAMVLYELLDVINQQINATGGYTYLVPGIGAVTYDTAVTDPTEGDEASQAVEMRGGTLRFANTKTAGGDWNWTNVITADGYLALAATIARLTTGYIGNVNGNYWNLDTGELRMAAANTTVGNQTLAQYISGNLGLDQQKVFNLLTNNGALQGLYMSNNNLYVNANYIASGYIGNVNGSSYWDLSNGTIVIVNTTKNVNNRYDQMRFGSVTFTDQSGWLNTRTGQQTAVGIMIGDENDYPISAHGRLYLIPNLVSVPSGSSSSGTESVILSRETLKLMSDCGGSRHACISMSGKYVEMNCTYESTVYPGICIESTGVHIYATRNDYTLNNGNTATSFNSAAYFYDSGIRFDKSLTIDGSLYCYGSGGKVGIGSSGRHKDLEVYGDATIWTDFKVHGTKSRVVSTDNYSDRLLYSYETSSPMFGDVGSAIIGDDGTCIVSIDDVFQETVRTDMAYQVFLQKCGQGDLWVSRKMLTYFIVEGTPNLAFDWEVKARQVAYENTRLEDSGMQTEEDIEELDVFDIYNDELNFIMQVESLYEEA